MYLSEINLYYELCYKLQKHINLTIINELWLQEMYIYSFLSSWPSKYRHFIFVSWCPHNYLNGLNMENSRNIVTFEQRKWSFACGHHAHVTTVAFCHDRVCKKKWQWKLPSVAKGLNSKVFIYFYVNILGKLIDV